MMICCQNLSIKSGLIWLEPDSHVYMVYDMSYWVVQIAYPSILYLYKQQNYRQFTQYFTFPLVFLGIVPAITYMNKKKLVHLQCWGEK